MDNPGGFAPQGRGRNGGRPSQLRIKTTTGIWTAVHNALNRPLTFTRENADGTLTVTPAAPNSETGEETRTIHTHHRYLYRGYLQIATRPLAIQKDGTWYYAPARPAAQGTPSQVCSGLGVWLLKPHPAPYGLVTTTGSTTQPLQWSSELTDTDLGLIYYNYRHYNPLDN